MDGAQQRYHSMNRANQSHEIELPAGYTFTLLEGIKSARKVDLSFVLYHAQTLYWIAVDMVSPPYVPLLTGDFTPTFRKIKRQLESNNLSQAMAILDHYFLYNVLRTMQESPTEVSCLLKMPDSQLKELMNFLVRFRLFSILLPCLSAQISNRKESRRFSKTRQSIIDS